jgi:hypothetical protein
MEDRVSPYSEKILQALAETLRIHGQLLCIDPESNALKTKQLTQVEAPEVG